MKNLKLTLAMLAIVVTAVPGSARAQLGLDPKLSVHGYLTQGVGAASGAPVYGLSDTLTADYRSAALQFSYEVSTKDRLALQISHRRLAASPLMAFEEQLEIDWAFYQRQLGPVALRAGRFAMPGGLYNEVRDVGTILPFFRAPFQMYPDGTETVDGVGATHNLALGSWALETSAFWGGTEYKNVFFTPQGPERIAIRNEGSTGGQVWLNTPIQGLRLGGSAVRWKTDGQAEHVRMASVDADFDRISVRGEYKVVEMNDMGVWTWYAQAGVRLNDKLHLVGQYETTDFEMTQPFPMPRKKMQHDGALGLNYKFSPNLVPKLEQHETKGYYFDKFVSPMGGGEKSRYGIASISVSF